MSIPSGSVTDSNGHRKYPWDTKGKVEYFDSVTTAIAHGYPKPALQFWSARVVASHIVKNIDSVVEQIGRTDEKKLIDSLRLQPQIESAEKARIGDKVHSAIEDYIRFQRRPLTKLAAVEKTLDQFENFLRDWNPRFLYTEVTVYSRKYGYAGTADSIISLDTSSGRINLVIDVKSGKGVWPEAAIQMSAYANADFIGQYGGQYGREIKIPKISGAAVLHLSPELENYEFIPVYIGPEVFKQFLHSLETYRFTYHTAPQLKLVYRHITPESAQRMNGRSPDWAKRIYKLVVKKTK